MLAARGLRFAICALLLATGSCATGPTASQVAREPDPAVALANRLSAQQGAYTEGYLGEGDHLIHYVEAGEGPTVLFVHGFPAFWYVWFDQMEALRACRRVIAIDAPGANLSAKPTDRSYYRIANLADRLDRVMAELAPDEKITLVGHDWGGALAWSYAENSADRLERLAVFSAPPYDLFLELLASNAEQQQRSWYMPYFNTLTRERIEADRIDRQIHARAYDAMVERGVLTEEEGDVFRAAVADPDTMYAGMEWYRANVPAFDAIDPLRDAWPRADAVARVPTLLVRGANDRTFVTEMGDLAQAHASELKVVTLDDVGHWTPFENPEPANAALTEFLGIKGGCP